MPFRAIRRKLREIDRQSRTVRHSVFDRIQGVAFIAAFFLAPFLTWKSQSWSVRTRAEPLATVAVYKGLSDDTLGGAIVTDIARTPKFPPSTIPLAEVRVVRDISSRGWPVTSLQRTSAQRLEAELLPACPKSREAEVLAAASDTLARGTPPGRQIAVEASEETHIGGWIFSIGGWWMMLTASVWLLLVPIRIGTRVHRVTRTVVRQGRIDKCHCPNCGYDARGSIMTGRCPECGGELYERPEW